MVRSAYSINGYIRNYYLRRTFISTHDTIVSDNASCFTSNDFIHLCKMNGIKHITSAPYHSSTNGMAERAVQIVKEGLKRLTCGTLETRLSRFIFTYRMFVAFIDMEKAYDIVNRK